MKSFLKIAGYTILDQMRNRSFYVLLGISLLFVVMIRGCYGGHYVINGQQVDSAIIARQVSRIVFQVIVVWMFVMVAMVSMKIFSRDRDDGGAVLFLSRPVRRWHYVLGRVAGTWLLTTAFMFVLHLAIFVTVWSKTGEMIPGYLAASLICSVNLLFVIACVALLSLSMPDFVAALFTLGIAFVGAISDGGHQLLSNPMVQSAMQSSGIAAHPALWRLFYPKLFMVQSFAGSIITNSEFTGMGPLNPVINVAFYCGLLITILIVVFNKREI
jgi:ABC-type transport system involved in multi-copper enzyme maturation permease subunit